jgi:hypothetical protein
MKKIISSALILSAFIFSCSKSEDSCSFSKETFQGKTYKITLIKVDSSGIDITSREINVFLNDPCSNTTIKLNSDGTTIENKPINCMGNSTDGFWSLKTINDINFINNDEVISYDCNSIIYIDKGPIVNGQYVHFTYKLSKI